MPVRVLVLGAHPDDAEYLAGGLIARHTKLGSLVKLISVTDGRSGHQSIPSYELIQIRRDEAAASGKVVGSEYVTWDFPDGSLTPSIEVREAIICEIRQFAPDLVLTHRTVDYHPDHRAVGQAVQDASYMVRVPKIVPAVQSLDRDPVVAYLNDPFTRPCPHRGDYVLDGTNEFDTVLKMMDCHRSQFYDWLPWIERVDPPASLDETTRLAWLRQWQLGTAEYKKSLFWNPRWGAAPEYIEAYEISEYAGKLTRERSQQLFPDAFLRS